MNPNDQRTLDIILDPTKKDKEKMDLLVSRASNWPSAESYLLKLVNKVVSISERAVELEPQPDLETGQGDRTQASSAEIGDTPIIKSKGPNYLAPKIVIPTQSERSLGLKLLAFNPRLDSPYHPAITAKWYELGQKLPIFTEHIDQRMFSKNYVGHDPRAGVILGIVAVSVALYEEALTAAIGPNSL